jgi:hypothetical protein
MVFEHHDLGVIIMTVLTLVYSIVSTGPLTLCSVISGSATLSSGNAECLIRVYVI